MSDMINHPNHYTNGIFPMECIDVVRHVDFCRGSAIKYLWRFQGKNGLEDVYKARKFLDFLAEDTDVIAGEVPETIVSKITDQAIKMAVDSGSRGASYQAALSILTLVSMDHDSTPEAKKLSLMLVNNSVDSLIVLLEEQQGGHLQPSNQ